MSEYIIKPDTMVRSSKSENGLYHWNFGTNTEPQKLIRCKDCCEFHPKDTEMWMDCNKPEHDFCWKHTEYDFIWDHADFYYVEPTDFCSKPDPKLDKE